MKKLLAYLFVCLSVSSCADKKVIETISISPVEHNAIVVLGNVQDAGSPQTGCQKSCCKDLWLNPVQDRKVVSLGLIDHKNGKRWIFEASPDFKSQNDALQKFAGDHNQLLSDGIFLTHAHMGHYTGLAFLGRESLNADQIPVYAMPRMRSFLSNNGPWDQLVNIKNIKLEKLSADSIIQLSDQYKVVPFLVPHRDEYTETVGFKVIGPKRSFLFIPDIDKWAKWKRSIIDEIAKVDYAFLDATFYNNAEIPNRDMSEIPHPFVEESMQLFDRLSPNEKSKVYFLHFNHTNQLLDKNSKGRKDVKSKGYNVATHHLVLEM